MHLNITIKVEGDLTLYQVEETKRNDLSELLQHLKDSLGIGDCIIASSDFEWTRDNVRI